MGAQKQGVRKATARPKSKKEAALGAEHSREVARQIAWIKEEYAARRKKGAVDRAHLVNDATGAVRWPRLTRSLMYRSWEARRARKLGDLRSKLTVPEEELLVTFIEMKNAAAQNLKGGTHFPLS
ncbi:hypothetical protein T492DRAFT_892981 [Pavlovales sp. CCMP2436]|nr:hypothetical protein T492DRAFT_892981 [Pavlovales sp. CCMP2436]